MGVAVVAPPSGRGHHDLVMVTTAMGWPLLVTASPWMAATSRGAAEARMQTDAVLHTIGLQLLHRRRTVEAKNHIGSSISMCRLQRRSVVEITRGLLVPAP